MVYDLSTGFLRGADSGFVSMLLICPTRADLDLEPEVLGTIVTGFLGGAKSNFGHVVCKLGFGLAGGLDWQLDLELPGDFSCKSAWEFTGDFGWESDLGSIIIGVFDWELDWELTEDFSLESNWAFIWAFDWEFDSITWGISRTCLG